MARPVAAPKKLLQLEKKLLLLRSKQAIINQAIDTCLTQIDTLKAPDRRTGSE